MTDRFSSSGLANAMVDLLKSRGIDARTIFRPRGIRDLMPFSVEIIEAGAAASACKDGSWRRRTTRTAQ